MTEPSSAPDNRQIGDDDEISLLELLIVLAKHKKIIFGLPIFVAVIAAVISLQLPIIFTASAKIFPPQQSQSASSAIMAQLGGIATLVGGAAGLKGPGDSIYIAMLNSRTVADALIQRFGLAEVYETKLPSRTRKALADVTSIAAGKDSIITIEVSDKDPKRAAEVANAYVDELIKFTSVLAVTEASQKRLFFERQLALAKENLAKAEASARRALQTDGLVKVDDQGRAMVEASARLRAQIAVKNVQISAMRTFAADRNPDLLFAQQELESMKRELAKIEGAGEARGVAKGGVGQGMESLHLLRDVKYHEALFELLAKQYELAKIDEAKDSSVIQVMDKAIEPDFRSKPKRTQIVLLSTLAAGILGVLLAFVREELDKASRDPQHSARLQAIKRYLAWR